MRAFGKSIKKVAIIDFGSGHISRNNLTETKASNLLNSIADLGVNLFNTARGYDLSEEIIGQQLSYRRKEIVISTKFGYGISGVNDWLYDSIIRGIDEALTKLTMSLLK